MVAPIDKTELRAAGLTHCHPGVGRPHGGRVAQLVPHVEGAGDLVQVDEGRLPAPVVFNSTVESVQPVISFLDTPRNKPAGASAMTWSSTYVLLVLLILPNNNLTCLAWMTGS